MIADDHRIRVQRLLRGERRTTDLDRLFADLRLIQPGRASVREVGHFAAHRTERNTGIALDRIANIQLSAKNWVKQTRGELPTIEDLRAVGKANLAIIPQERVRERLRMTRQAAGTAFRKAVDKMNAGQPLKKSERDVVSYLGFSMTWQFSFGDRELFEDFSALLLEEGSLLSPEADDFRQGATFVTLHALALMHGATLKLPDGSLAPLRLAASVETGMLRIKADIPVDVVTKPISMSVPMFETTLLAADHSDAQALTHFTEPAHPVEVENGSRLVCLV